MVTPTPSIELEYVSYVKTMVLCIFSMVQFSVISSFYYCNHYFSKIAIFETCHKSIWNFNEVFRLFHFHILVIIIFSKIAIFETCHKSIWNFNEVFNSYFEVELCLYEIHLKLRSNGNENHLILDFIFESPF